jgi:antitoxin MazE
MIYISLHLISQQERVMQVAKWGNSLAVRLPAKLVEELGLKEGDDVEIKAGDNGGLALVRTPDRLELLAEMRKFRGRRPKDYAYSRDESYRTGTMNEAPAPRGFHED